MAIAQATLIILFLLGTGTLMGVSLDQTAIEEFGTETNTDGTSIFWNGSQWGLYNITSNDLVPYDDGTDNITINHTINAQQYCSYNGSTCWNWSENYTITQYAQGMPNYLYGQGNIYLNETTLNESIIALSDGITYPPTSYNIIYGTQDDGNLASMTTAYDENSLNISEANGANALEININFTGVQSFDSIIGRIQYIGGTGHEISIELWNYNTSAWDHHHTITDTSEFTTIYTPIFDNTNHVNNSLVQMKIHHEDNGIPSHDLYIEYIALQRGSTTLTNSEHDSLAGRNYSTNHPGYTFNHGRSGGQTIIGDTEANGDLTLQSTSNANYGDIYLQNKDRIRIEGTSNQILLYDTNDALNEKMWDIYQNSGNLQIRTLTDALGAGNTLIDVDRTGTTITDVEFVDGNITFNPNNNNQDVTFNGWSYNDILRVDGEWNRICINCQGWDYPQGKLHIQSTDTNTDEWYFGYGDLWLRNEDNTLGNMNDIFFTTTDTGGTQRAGSAIRSINTGRGAGYTETNLAFFTGTNNNDMIQGIRINQNGSVIIGNGTTARSGLDIQEKHITIDNAMQIRMMNSHGNDSGNIRVSASDRMVFKTPNETAGYTWDDQDGNDMLTLTGEGALNVGGTLETDGSATLGGRAIINNDKGNAITEIHRQTTQTASARAPLELYHRTSGNMLSGFGTRIDFFIEDGGSTDNIGQLVFLREGSDDKGEFELRVANAGANTVRLDIDYDGHVGIKTSAAASATHRCINGDEHATCSSAQRYKNNITNITTNVIPIIQQFTPITYTWKPEYNIDQRTKLGLLAENVEKIDTRLIEYQYNSTTETYTNKTEGINYDMLTALNIKGIQEQQEQINTLTNYVLYLKDRLCTYHPADPICT